jgi:hypothetical protein
MDAGANRASGDAPGGLQFDFERGSGGGFGNRASFGWIVGAALNRRALQALRCWSPVYFRRRGSGGVHPCSVSGWYLCDTVVIAR